MKPLDPRLAALTLFYTALFRLSSLPGSAAGPHTPLWRFISNMARIPVFAGAFCLASTSKTWPAGQWWVWVLALAVACAVFDEWDQRPTPERAASLVSLVDAGLDVAGVLSALPVVRLWRGAL